MKIEDIKHPELKQLINMSYLHGENNNPEMVEKTDCEIKNYLSENTFIISTENNDLLTIPILKRSPLDLLSAASSIGDSRCSMIFRSFGSKN